MKIVKKSFKKLTSCLVSALFMCSLPISAYAMQRAQNCIQSSEETCQGTMEELYLDIPGEMSSPAFPERTATARPDEFPDAPSSSVAFSDTPTATASPTMPDLQENIEIQYLNEHFTEFFNVQFIHNSYNGCKIMRIDPTYNFMYLYQKKKLIKVCLENYLESIKPDDPSQPDIFKNYDLICIDKRIGPVPSTFLGPHDWIEIRRHVNSTLYINRASLALRKKTDTYALRRTIFFALYPCW